MPETSDARQSRILKELRKLAFDHPGPVTGAQFVSDVRGSGEAYAPVPTQGKPAPRNKRKEIFGNSPQKEPQHRRPTKVRVSPKTSEASSGSIQGF